MFDVRLAKGLRGVAHLPHVHRVCGVEEWLFYSGTQNRVLVVPQNGRPKMQNEAPDRTFLRRILTLKRKPTCCRDRDIVTLGRRRARISLRPAGLRENRDNYERKKRYCDGR
jgi:hypothetical protein